MDNNLQVLFLKEFEHHADELEIIKFLLSNPIWDYVQLFFTRLRKYDEGLDFAESVLDIIQYRKTDLSDKQYEKFSTCLISLKLDMLNCLNLWRDFIEYYDLILNDDNYRFTYTYVKSRNDADFNKFVLYEDTNYKYVHFLYLQYHLYKKTKGKFEKWLRWKNVEHLKKHQRDRLCNEEIRERYEQIISLLQLEIQNNDIK